MSKETPTKTKAKKGAKAKTTKASEEKTKKVAPKKAVASKKNTTKKVAAKKPVAKKPAAKKPAAKPKAAPKKAAASKKTTSKTVAKKAPAKEVAPKNSPAKKPVAKKTVAKKAPPVKKVAVKKAPAKKPVAKKAPAPKAPKASNASASMNKPSTSNSDDANSFTKMLVIIATIVAIVSLYFLLANPVPNKPEAREVGSHAASSSANQMASIGGQFELIDTDGNVFKSEYLVGKPSLVYFGFTFCPNICPTLLGKMTEVVNVLDKYQIDVTPVFITIDPDRDDGKMLKSYMTSFHPKFIGLTGNQEQVKKAADSYKVYFETDPDSDNGNNDYQINHTSFIYLLDKNGNYMKHFDMEMSADEIIEYIRINLR